MYLYTWTREKPVIIIPWEGNTSPNLQGHTVLRLRLARVEFHVRAMLAASQRRFPHQILHAIQTFFSGRLCALRLSILHM